MAGAGKKVIVYFPEMQKAELMYKLFDFVSNAEYPGVIRYVDAVEVALCFGWIDSTQKRIDDGKPVQHFTPRSKRSNWCRNNIEKMN